MYFSYFTVVRLFLVMVMPASSLQTWNVALEKHLGWKIVSRDCRIATLLVRIRQSKWTLKKWNLVRGGECGTFCMVKCTDLLWRRMEQPYSVHVPYNDKITSVLRMSGAPSCTVEVSWFNASQQLSTMQPLSHFPQPPVGWARDLENKSKTHGLT